MRLWRYHRFDTNLGIRLGAGIGIGSVGNGACQGLARNPEVQPKLMVFMILGMALAESVAIYGLVISLILLYANPLIK